MSKMSFVLAFLLLTSGLMESVICGRILVWETQGAKSHMMAMDALVRGLARNNHSITYVVYHQPQWLSEEKNVDFVHIGIDLSQLFNDNQDVFNFNPFNLSLPLEPIAQLQHDYLNNPILKEHIELQTKFDLTIVSSTAVDMGLYLARNIFKTPIVLFASGFSDAWTATCMGNPINPSYISGEFADVGSKMNFFERLQNTIMVPFLLKFIGDNINAAEKEVRLLFDDPSIDIGAIERTADMFILNQHPLFDKAKPLNPNTVLVGGIHVKKNRTKLPDDIQTWLDGATHGVIYVSLGSVTQGSKMPREKREAMVSAFADLKERVIWKWETEQMPNKPENVMLKKWCPQQDILGEKGSKDHPNVKMFVTHGGLLSTYESVYFATPMLVIPGFADQFANAHFVKEFGLGDRMRWSEVNHQSFENMLLKILKDEEYAAKAKLYSEIFKDEPMDPVDKAVFYAEYVMRHQGAPHLRPSSMDLYWFQYFLLDIMTCLIVVLGLILFAFKLIFSSLKKRLAGNGASPKKRRKQE